jgi:uncharacterized protein GlcG (DUF336 family)
LSAGALTVTTSNNSINILQVNLEVVPNILVVEDNGATVATYNNSDVTDITITAGSGLNDITIADSLLQNATIIGGAGTDILRAGGGPTTLIGNGQADRLISGTGDDTLVGSSALNFLGAPGINVLGGGGGGMNELIGGNPARNRFYGFSDTDSIVNSTIAFPVSVDLRGGMAPPNLSNTLGLEPSPGNLTTLLTTSEVNTLLQRASAATANANQAIVAILDRGGRLLGVRVGSDVSTAITGNPANLVFAIDGAMAEARTGAFFANDDAPLTSYTVQQLSETTITEQEVNSNPSITDPNSTLRGPGYVAPVSINGNFPEGIAFTPEVDLFGIEGTNRDSSYAVGPDNIRGTADDVLLPERFNINPAYIPEDIIQENDALAPPNSFGVISGLEPTAQGRGIGTLPGGVPIFKIDPSTGKGVLVGGIGVFFPGTTGYATEENSVLSSTYDPKKIDLAQEAAYIAYAALGGVPVSASGVAGSAIGTLGGVAPLPEITLPNGRLDLVGVTLNVYGPGGTQGIANLLSEAPGYGTGQVNGTLEPFLAPNAENQVPANPNTLLPGTGPMVTLEAGTPVPEGFIVTPHAAADGSLTAAQVMQIIQDAVTQAEETRAAIRLPLDTPTAMNITVTSDTGEILGMFRMPDTTVFSIDVSVAKARNVYYQDNPAILQPEDAIPQVPAGTASTARTYKYLASPYYPMGIDGSPPGPWSQLNDNHAVQVPTGLGPSIPASDYQSVYGYSSFNPGTNFRDNQNSGVFLGTGMFQNPLLNRDGIVFFPGSSGIYINSQITAGFGVSGDGVDQDDVVTFAGATGYAAPSNITVDNFFVNGVRLPYQKFNRQPNLPTTVLLP